MPLSHAARPLSARSVMPSTTVERPVLLSAQAALLSSAVFGTALAVSGRLGFGNEAYTVPKACMLGGAAALAALTLRHVHTLRRTTFDLLLALYLLHGVLSTLSSPTWAMASVALVPEWSATLVAALAAVFVGERSERRALLLDVLVAASTLVSCIALLEALDVPLPWAGARRPHSTLGNRNFVGAEAAIFALVAFVRAAAEPRLVRLASLWALCTVVVLSRCRSAWLGLTVSAIVCALLYALRRRHDVAKPFSFRGMRWALLAALLGAATAAYVPWPGLRWTDSKAPLTDTLSRLVERESGTGRERMADAQLSMALAAQHPLWGVGPRSWDDAASSAAHEVPGRHATPQHFWTTPNSDAARTLAERGLVGFGLLLAALVALVVRALRHWQKRPQSELLALVGALSVAAVNMLLDAPLFRASSLLSIALLLALLRVPGPRVHTLPKAPVHTGLVGVAILIALLTGLRAYAAAVVAQAPESAEAAAHAQRLFPRPDLAEVLALHHARDLRCAEAAEAGDLALSLSPHHWGVPHALAHCFDAQGDFERADHYRAVRDRIEPHVRELVEAHADLASGYERR